ncbi:MAG: FAD-dependent oxidoreductase [Candidatus Nanopelagicales bacterium]
MTERVVVVGGDAAGMSAASLLKRRRGDDVEVIAIERGSYTSYSACGIPYWIAGDVGSAEELVARSPEEHRRRGIDLRMHTEVVEIDLNAGHVVARSVQGADRIGFDQLVLATGAVPVRPDLPGIDAGGVLGVQTLDDGAAVLAALTSDVRRVVVVGAGYIGVEISEAVVRRDLDVTVLDAAAEPMTTLDPDMGALVHTAMEGLGIDVRPQTVVSAIETDHEGRARAVVTDAQTFPADLVILGIGVRPNTALAHTAGLPLGDAGGLVTDDAMRVGGHDAVWAGGDCVEVLHRVSGRLVHVPLGTHANKHGVVIGTNLSGGAATFPGVVGTAVSRVCDLEIARTGLTTTDAERAGYDVVSAVIESTTRAGYFPGTNPLTVKMLAARGSGRLLGVQIVGREDSGKRIDAAAVALWNAMSVQEVMGLDLAYAPPFSPVWDPVLVAARKVSQRLAG